MAPIIVWSILIYAVLVAIGGIMGYVKAKSKVSLISGVGSGLVLLIAWYVSQQNPSVGILLSLVIAIVLLGVFIQRFRLTRAFMPAGLMVALSLVASILFALGWLSVR